jgi:hypothetical protein
MYVIYELSISDKCRRIRWNTVFRVMSCASTGPPVASVSNRSESEWKAKLTPMEYNVLRNGGTEPAHRGPSKLIRFYFYFYYYYHHHYFILFVLYYVGPYIDNFASGKYLCKGCGILLYESKDKMHTTSGWPDFSTSFGG